MSGASYYVVSSEPGPFFQEMDEGMKEWLGGHGWYRRFGDDCDPVAAFAAFFGAVTTAEYASIHYLA